MAASSQHRWMYNEQGATKPMIRKVNFQAGATQAIKDGQILELSGGNWIPLAGDRDLSAGVGAIAATKIEDGDRAGMYPVIVPRPGDVFRFALSAAAAPALGTAVYPSGTVGEVVATSGSNILGHVVDDGHIPEQGHLSVDASPDAGTTARTISHVGISFEASNSWYSLLFKA